MRLAVEALGAEFGGIRVYLENLLQAWSVAHPDDELLVVTKAGSELDTGEHQRHELAIRSPDPIFRPLAQTLRLPPIIEQFGAAASLATIPVTGLRRPSYPQAVVVHDLRHELRPEEFSASRRAVRRVAYTRAYAVADGFISVSQRTLNDLHALHPRTTDRPAKVVPHGADHALAWGVARGDGPAIAFGHHTNKRPDLVIAAWAAGIAEGVDLPPLRVLGVSGELRPELAAMVEQHQLHEHVQLDGYVSDDQLRDAMLAMPLLVLPSTFEGFGIPIIEAMVLGAPVVIGPDPGAVETAGGDASVMTDWTPESLLSAVRIALAFDAAHLDRARARASSMTWQRCATATREFLLGLLPGA